MVEQKFYVMMEFIENQDYMLLQVLHLVIQDLQVFMDQHYHNVGLHIQDIHGHKIVHFLMLVHKDCNNG